MQTPRKNFTAIARWVPVENKYAPSLNLNILMQKSKALETEDDRKKTQANVTIEKVTTVFRRI